jgi:methionine salvage enolase-phosphatase E1
MELTIDFDPPSLGVLNKFDVNGYERIKKRTGIEKWTFFSDVPMEIEAARKAGMVGYVVVRKGNKPLTNEDVEEHTLLQEGFGNVLEVVSR